MKTVLLQLFMAIGISTSAALASPNVLDLSKSHSVNDLKRSGLVLKELAGGSGGRDFSFKNQEVIILLPGGRSIQQWVELGIIDTETDLLTRLSITGGVMPQEQAFQVAKLFLQNFNLPMAGLDEWNKRNQNNDFRGDGFGATSGWGYYPRISLAIDRSVNKLYPWVVRCEMEWGRREQRDWNEERVWRELPPPTVAAISLNPPSGQKYERRDAYKESLEEQAKFEKDLASKDQALSPTAMPSPSLTNPPPEPSPIVPSESPKSYPWSWIIGAILFVALIGGVLIKLLRK